MKIVSFRAENFKRLSVVEITPTGNLVEISGKNGQGKTSVLDAIWAALSGKAAPKQPVRKGQKKAVIRLDLGEYTVTRTFTAKDGGEFGSTITVENKDGMRAGSPQETLNRFIGKYALDPVSFLRAKPDEKIETLRAFVPGFDFHANAVDRQKVFDQRTDVNRRAKELRAQAAGFQVPDGASNVAIDESALVQQMQTAGEQNADLERQRGARRTKTQEIERTTREMVELRSKAAALRRQADEAASAADDLGDHILKLEAELKSTPALPEPIDLTGLRQQIDAAKRRNAIVSLIDRRDEAIGAAEKAEGSAADLTKQIEALDEARTRAIATAKMPIDGIDFSGDTVMLNGVPFEQASDAEQLRTSVAIAAAMSPKLRVIRIRDGSLLDDDGMKLLAQFAEEKDMQIWIERVASDGKVGFVLEDGHLKDAPLAEAAE